MLTGRGKGGMGGGMGSGEALTALCWMSFVIEEYISDHGYSLCVAGGAMLSNDGCGSTVKCTNINAFQTLIFLMSYILLLGAF